MGGERFRGTSRSARGRSIENGGSLEGSGGKDVLNMSLNSPHSASSLMFSERLSPYSIVSRKSTSSVSTLGGISSSSSSAVTELIVSPHPGARSYVLAQQRCGHCYSLLQVIRQYPPGMTVSYYLHLGLGQQAHDFLLNELTETDYYPGVSELVRV